MAADETGHIHAAWDDPNDPTVIDDNRSEDYGHSYVAPFQNYVYQR